VRSRWWLAEALAEVGDRDEGAAQWRLAAAAAGKLGARPLGADLDDLARRTRLDAQGTGQPHRGRRHRPPRMGSPEPVSWR
jgi:hypothetical protein